MNMTRQITQQSKKDVDAQINPASLDEEHSKGRNEDLRTGQTGASEGGSGTVMMTTRTAEADMMAQDKGTEATG